MVNDNLKLSIFSANIKALRDVWLLGDSFMRSLWPTFAATRAKAVAANTTKPYLFDFFNVIPLYPGVGDANKSLIGRIHNELVNGLDDHDWLPSYLVVLPDKNIIEAAKFGGFGCKVVFEKMVTWLVNAINDSINLRRDDIIKKKPGPAPQPNEPLIIWIPMLVRPYINTLQRVMSSPNVTHSTTYW